MHVAAVGVAELAARVQDGEDEFEAALLVLRVHVDRDAAAVVRDRERVAGFVQRDRDVVGVAVEVLVDGVVDDFPREVVQPLASTPPMYMDGRLRTGSSPSRT